MANENENNMDKIEPTNIQRKHKDDNTETKYHLLLFVTS